MERQKNNTAAPTYCVIVLAAFIAILAIPASREVFRQVSSAYPYPAGFVKFALLATVGELIAGRITNGFWIIPKKIVARAMVWGIIGAVLAFIMKIFSAGVVVFLHYTDGGGIGSLFVKAFITSCLLNFAFGPTMMAFHKMTDTYLDMKAKGEADTSIAAVAKTVDWAKFINFIILKTVPIFWVPAHTVTFMLPAEYQLVMAASLSIALGIILSLQSKK